jgi:hypothetical protein
MSKTNGESCEKDWITSNILIGGSICKIVCSTDCESSLIQFYFSFPYLTLTSRYIYYICMDVCLPFLPQILISCYPSFRVLLRRALRLEPVLLAFCSSVSWFTTIGFGPKGWKPNWRLGKCRYQLVPSSMKPLRSFKPRMCPQMVLMFK